MIRSNCKHIVPCKTRCFARKIKRCDSPYEKSRYIIYLAQLLVLNCGNGCWMVEVIVCGRLRSHALQGGHCHHQHVPLLPAIYDDACEAADVQCTARQVHRAVIWTKRKIEIQWCHFHLGIRSDHTQCLGCVPEQNHTSLLHD